MPTKKIQNKAGRSIMRNIAGEEANQAFKNSCRIFLKSLYTFIKQYGEVNEWEEDSFTVFINSTNGIFRMRMRQIRKEYESSLTQKKIKQEIKWITLINTLKNAFKQQKESKVKSVIYNLSLYC